MVINTHNNIRTRGQNNRQTDRQTDNHYIEKHSYGKNDEQTCTVEQTDIHTNGREKKRQTDTEGRTFRETTDLKDINICKLMKRYLSQRRILLNIIRYMYLNT